MANGVYLQFTEIFFLLITVAQNILILTASFAFVVFFRENTQNVISDIKIYEFLRSIFRERKIKESEYRADIDLLFLHSSLKNKYMYFKNTSFSIFC